MSSSRQTEGIPSAYFPAVDPPIAERRIASNNYEVDLQRSSPVVAVAANRWWYISPNLSFGRQQRQRQRPVFVHVHLEFAHERVGDAIEQRRTAHAISRAAERFQSGGMDGVDH